MNSKYFLFFNQSNKDLPLRLDGLDQLRGILSLLIMIYHYTFWTGINNSANNNPLSLVGLYGVTTFYILSGFTLYYVYRNKKLNRRFLLLFFIKRFFRIAPLFWLASTITLGLILVNTYLSNQYSLIPWSKYWLSMTFLFSWFAPTQYLVSGGWSIGNEVFFYTSFPVFIRLIKAGFSNHILILLSIVQAIFSFQLLDQNISVANQWNIYIHPLNQILPFFIGLFLGEKFCEGRFNRNSKKFFFILISIFCIVSFLIEHDKSILGFNRFLMIGIMSSITIASATIKFNDTFFSKILIFFGQISYSVYLLHHIVYLVIAQLVAFTISNSSIQITVFSTFFMAFPLTILISYFTYNLYEKRFVDFGNLIVSKLK